MPPTANAGPDQSIHAGDTVTLDGSASFDDDTASEALVYAWTLIGKPAGSSATLSGANTAHPSFTADLPGVYVAELLALDQGGFVSAPDQVNISSGNLAPTAAITADQLAFVGRQVALDGTRSVDPDNDPLTFSWTLRSRPSGSVATIVNAGSPMAGLTPDRGGVYTIELRVSDPLGPGTPATIDITATTAEAEVVAVENFVAALEPAQVTTAGNQTAFRNFLTQTVGASQRGNTAIAIDKLEKAIARTDGCVLRGAPDGNGPGMDWITDCAAQTEAYNVLKAALDALKAQQQPS